MAQPDQIKGRREGVGLRAYDPTRAFPGFTLYAPVTGNGTVYLVDMEGNVAHTWNLPYPPGYHGCLREDGSLLYNGNNAQDPARTQFWLGAGGVVLEAGWRGRILWELNHPDHHRDAIRLRNGNVLLLCMAVIPPEIASKVQGGLPNSEANGAMYADYLLEMTTAGKRVREWRSWEHLDPDVDRITAPQERRVWWTHGNAVGEMPDRRIIASFRNISTIVMIDWQSGEIVWKLGAPTLAQQHAPVPLENGNLLIFDNGTHRMTESVPYSRVIEIAPTTKEIVWKYQEPRPWDFFSPYISNAQRLPNGNTLICEGDFGRIFEVTHEGELVWEFVNPHFALSSNGLGSHNAVFRAYRYSEDQVERASRLI